MNKTVQDLKVEIETIEKAQMEPALEMKKGPGSTIANRIQGMEEPISGTQATIERMDASLKENAKCKKFLT